MRQKVRRHRRVVGCRTARRARETILVAAGRRPNVGGLGLDRAGVVHSGARHPRRRPTPHERPAHLRGGRRPGRRAVLTRGRVAGVRGGSERVAAGQFLRPRQPDGVGDIHRSGSGASGSERGGRPRAVRRDDRPSPGGTSPASIAPSAMTTRTGSSSSCRIDEAC